MVRKSGGNVIVKDPFVLGMPNLLYKGWLAAGNQQVSKPSSYKSQESTPNVSHRVSKPQWKKLAQSRLQSVSFYVLFRVRNMIGDVVRTYVYVTPGLVSVRVCC